MQFRNMLVRTVAQAMDISEEEVNQRQMVVGQVPPSFRMKYPCVKYNLEKVKTMSANNTPFFFRRFYSVTVIDSDPESILFEAIKQIPKCTVDRLVVAENLYNFHFTIQY